MIGERREKFKFLSEKVGLYFSKSKLHPNFFTLISLLFGFLCFLSLVKNNLPLALVFFVLGALCDFIDGAVARVSLKVTKIGAYLDTICDRYVEGMVLLGFLFLPLPKVFLPAFVWISLSLLGALITTYSKAAAKEKELIEEEIKMGLLGRPERLILIFFMMILGLFNLYWLVYLLITFTVLSHFTALERIFSVFKSYKRF
jgi:phosphatidylglycerophosphate synthase